MFPSRKQWSSWSLPSKLTAIGTYVGVSGVVLSIVFFLFSNSTNKWDNPPSTKKESRQSPSVLAGKKDGIEKEWGEAGNLKIARTYQNTSLSYS